MDRPPKAWSPQYFMGIADHFHTLAEQSQKFGMPKGLVTDIEMAAIQFRYAADAIFQANVRAKKADKNRRRRGGSKR